MSEDFTPPPRVAIKQRALEENLPADSELRNYLVGKEETTRHASARPGTDLRRFRAAYRDFPRTLLIMPPMCMYEGAVKRVIPPLGLCYIAAQLEREGIESDILDCIVEGVDTEERVADGVWRFGMSEDGFRSWIAARNHDVYAFSMIYSSDIENLYRYAEIVKEMKPTAIVIAGGLHASIYTERFLRDGVRQGRRVIDFVIRGEGELRLGQFLRHLAVGRIDRNADGLAGWLDDQLFVNPQFQQIENLDVLPYPAYHKVPIEKYFDHNVPFSPYPQGNRVMQILTSRGCPIGCTFCASTNFAKAYRVRSVDSVIAEVAFYKERYHIDEIQFADDNLTLNKGRSIDLFTKLRSAGLPWCTPNGIMVNTLDDEVLDAMIRSGLYQISETATKPPHPAARVSLAANNRRPRSSRFEPSASHRRPIACLSIIRTAYRRQRLLGIRHARVTKTHRPHTECDSLIVEAVLRVLALPAFVHVDVNCRFSRNML